MSTPITVTPQGGNALGMPTQQLIQQPSRSGSSQPVPALRMSGFTNSTKTSELALTGTGGATPRNTEVITTSMPNYGPYSKIKDCSMYRDQLYLLSEYDISILKLTKGFDLLSSKRLSIPERARQIVARDSKLCVSSGSTGVNKIILMDANSGAVLKTFDGEIDSAGYGRLEMGPLPSATDELGKLFPESDDESCVLWRNSRFGISVVNLRFLHLDMQFKAFWPSGFEPRYAAISRARNKIVGYSVTQQGLHCVSVLTLPSDGRGPELVQIEMAMTEDLIGVALSDDGDYLICASAVIIKETYGSSKRMLKMKAMSFTDTKVRVEREKIITGLSSNLTKYSKLSTGLNLYCVTDGHQLHLVKFVSALKDFEIAGRMAEPVQIYKPGTNVILTAFNSDCAVLLAEGTTEEPVKIFKTR